MKYYFVLLIIGIVFLSGCTSKQSVQDQQQKESTTQVSEKVETTQATNKSQNCDPSYPDVCIPSPPPDLDCADIRYRRFTVVAPDPHRFDIDKDGIGCESTNTTR